MVWSCHVGVDEPNDLARTAWEFLRPSVQAAGILDAHEGDHSGPVFQYQPY